MTGWIIVGCIALILLGISLIPVGIEIRYNGETEVRLSVLGIRFRSGGKKKHGKPKQQSGEASGKKKPTGERRLQDWLTHIPTLLRRFRKKLLIRELKIHAVFGGADPADAALNYGRAWAAIGIVMPPLQQAFRIRKQDVRAVYCDTCENIRLDAAVWLSLTVGQLLGLAARALCLYWKNKHSKQSEKAVEPHEQPNQ